MCRYSFAFILETYLNLCIRLFGTDFDCRARIAICHRIFQDIIESTAHLIIEFSQEGGFEGAANL